MGMGSGGGSSGKVEYPAYLQTCHGDWLNATGADTISTSITATMNTALANSPYATALAYDPTTDLATAEVPVIALAGLSTISTVAEALSKVSDVAGVVDSIVTVAGLNDRITEEMDAYADMVDADINTKVLPKFRRGMQDINAVQSSSFVIGEALIWAERDRDVAKFVADIKLRAYDKRNDMIVAILNYLNAGLTSRVNLYQTAAHYASEFARIKITAMKEQTDMNIELDEKDAEWDLKVYQHGGNLMAAIAGAAATVNKKPNQFMSALGGAMSGVAAGASIGGAPGAAIGGIIGGIAGLLG